MAGLLKFLKPIGRWIVRHASTLLTISGTALIAGTVVSAIFDAPKAIETHEEMVSSLSMVDTSGYSKKEKLIEKSKVSLKFVWKQIKNLIRTLLLGTAAVACFWSAHIIDIKNLAAMTSVATTAINEKERIANKIEEKYGPEAKNETIKDVDKDIVAAAGGVAGMRIVGEHHAGDVPCHNTADDVWFWGTKEKIRLAAQAYNGYIHLNNYGTIREWGSDYLKYSYDYSCNKMLDKAGWRDDRTFDPMIDVIELGLDENGKMIFGYEILYSGCEYEYLRECR